MGAQTSRPNEPFNPYAPPQHTVRPVTATYVNSKASRKYKDTGGNDTAAYYAQPSYQGSYPGGQYPVIYQNGQAGYYAYPQQFSPQVSQAITQAPLNPQLPSTGAPITDEPRTISSSNAGHGEQLREEQATDLPSVSQPVPTPGAESTSTHNTNRSRSDSPLAHPLPDSPQPVQLPGEQLHGTRDRSPVRRHSVQEERRRSPLDRPLPALPQDIYETEQYRSLTQGPGALTGGTIQVYPEGWFEKRDLRKKPKGILRSFSTTTQARPREPQRRDSAPASQTEVFSERANYRPSHHLQRSTPNVPNPLYGQHRSPVSYSSMSTRLPQLGPPPPPMTFDKHSGLSHISPHRILYKDKLYPTAFHLLEAHRFLGSRNDLAERIRQAESVRDVYTLSAALNKQSRQDWADIILEKMDDVQCMKFRQHPDLRAQLLSTGTADLIFADRSDPYWGDGPLGHGSNELGKSLVRVREKLLYGDVKEEKKWSSMISKFLG